MRSGGRRHGGYRRRGYYGKSQALKHIEAARRFSTEMGGLDDDVKSYFFSLKASELRRILDAYEEEHGVSAREYAERTIPKWRLGRVSMSGMIAERLFGLMPRFMPLNKKYELTEGMWRHLGPSSKKMLRVGLNASVDDVVAKVREHITQVVIAYHIPASMERRFAWLSHGDIAVKQQLLNHLREQEKHLVITGARAQVALLLDRFRTDVHGQIGRMTHVFQIGNHELHLVFERDRQGVAVEDFRHFQTPSKQKTQLSSWVIAAVVVVVIILIMRQFLKALLL